VLHFGAAFRAGEATEGLMGYFAVHAAKAVQDVTHVFEVIITFFAPISDLGVDADVVVAAVAKLEADADVLFCRRRRHVTS